jgi:hypothetical protein
VLGGEVGDFVTIARQERTTGNWFIGGITDENARDIDFSLDFLDEGQTYKATIYKDAPDAHWNNNPTALEIEKLDVTSKSNISIKLAEGGGFAISLMK